MRNVLFYNKRAFLIPLLPRLIEDRLLTASRKEFGFGKCARNHQFVVVKRQYEVY